MTDITSEQIIDDLSFCVIDLETTGGNHSKDKIIEIGMVKVKERKIVDEKSFLVNPETDIPDFIQNLTNISQKDVKDKPVIEDLIDEILEFIADDIIVAHNTSFDVPFLNGVLRRLKKDELKNKVICTNVMTKHLIPDILNSNLNYMSRLFNISHSKAHRAHDDAKATAKLLVIYLDIFIKKGLKKVNQLYYPRNKFELDRTHFEFNGSNDDVLNFIKDQTCSLLVVVKGERGLIHAVLPLQSPKEELDFVKDVLSKLKWKIITIKLLKPLIDGIFQFNNHYLKYPEEIRLEIKNYLEKKYHCPDEEKVKLEKIDFLITHHLIADQILSYSFLHLNTNTRSLFKIPAQKKKLYQHLLNQNNKFENNQKGHKKHLIHPDLIPLVESFLGKSKNSGKYLFLSRKDVKNDKEHTLKVIESYVKTDENLFNFPNSNL